MHLKTKMLGTRTQLAHITIKQNMCMNYEIRNFNSWYMYFSLVCQQRIGVYFILTEFKII